MDAAVEFAKKGPRKLEELRVDMEDKSLPSYDAFKKIDIEKVYGPAGDGYEYTTSSNKARKATFRERFEFDPRHCAYSEAAA